MSDNLLNIIIKAQDMASGVMNRVGGSMQRLQRSAVNLGKQGFGAMQNAWSAAENTIKVGAVAIAAGLAFIVKSSISAASEYEEVSGKFNVVFGDMTESTRSWVNETSKAMGRSRVDFENYMATLQDTFVPMGFARDEASEMAKQITRLGVDLASFNNMSDSEAIERLTSTMVGNHENVRKFGIIINEATLEQELFNMGITEGTKAASEAQKMQARLNIVVAGSKDAMGDAERTASSWANQMKRLQANITDVQIFIGNKLLPLFSPLLQQLNDFIVAVDLEAVLDGTIAKLDELKTRFIELIEPIRPMIDQFDRIAGVQAILAGLAAVILAVVVPALAIMAFKVIAATWPFVAIGLAVAALYYAFSTNMFGIRDAWQQVSAIIVSVYQSVIAPQFEGMREQLQQLWVSFMALFNVIQPYIMPILKVLGVIIGVAIVGAVLVLINAFKLFIAQLRNAFDFARNTILNFQTIWRGLTDLVVGAITGNWGRAFRGLGLIVSGVFSQMVNVARTAFRAITNPLNTLIDTYNRASGVFGGAQLPSIPQFATGTNYAPGGMALVGERGPEIVNLARGATVTPNNQLSGMGGGSSINLTVNMGNYMGTERDKRNMVEDIGDALENLLRQRKLI